MSRRRRCCRRRATRPWTAQWWWWWTMRPTVRWSRPYRVARVLSSPSYWRRTIDSLAVSISIAFKFASTFRICLRSSLAATRLLRPAMQQSVLGKFKYRALIIMFFCWFCLSETIYFLLMFSLVVANFSPPGGSASTSAIEVVMSIPLLDFINRMRTLSQLATPLGWAVVFFCDTYVFWVWEIICFNGFFLVCWIIVCAWKKDSCWPILTRFLKQSTLVSPPSRTICLAMAGEYFESVLFII